MISLAEKEWAHVQIDDVVFSAVDGQEWVVHSRVGSRVSIRRVSDGKRHAGEFTGMVEVREALDDMKDAVEQVGRNLGAVALCPAEYDEPGPLLAHLYVFHGMRFNAEEVWESIRATNILHAGLHDQPAEPDESAPGGGVTLAHHHDPAYAERNRG